MIDINSIVRKNHETLEQYMIRIYTALDKNIVEVLKSKYNENLEDHYDRISDYKNSEDYKHIITPRISIGESYSSSSFIKRIESFKLAKIRILKQLEDNLYDYLSKERDETTKEWFERVERTLELNDSFINNLRLDLDESNEIVEERKLRFKSYRDDVLFLLKQEQQNSKPELTNDEKVYRAFLIIYCCVMFIISLIIIAKIGPLFKNIPIVYTIPFWLVGAIIIYTITYQVIKILNNKTIFKYLNNNGLYSFVMSILIYMSKKAEPHIFKPTKDNENGK